MESIGPPHFRGGGSRGELIALTGRQKGLRRPLSTPLTFVGRAAVCDVRLNLPGIDPFHCLFVHVPLGVMVRDLNSTTGTFINGERISQTAVTDGDTLTVGPLQFLIRLPPHETDPWPPQENKLVDSSSPEVSKTKEALRIQAAAVAAQHTAITEEEIRLSERQRALHEQEQQLAHRLEADRLHLEALHTQTQAEREALHTERAEYEEFVALVATCLTDAQKQLVQTNLDLQAERQRLVQTAARLNKRNQTLLAKKQEELDWREEQLANEALNLQKETQELRVKSHRLQQERIHLVTEYELGRRRLAESWQNLRRAQAKWHKRRRLERAALKVQARDQEQQLQEIATQTSRLQAEKVNWQRHKHLLEMEVAGLDRRIRAGRLELHLAAPQVVPAMQTGSALALTTEITPPSLDDFLGFAWQLADQRRELAEHWSTLALTEDEWIKERRRTLAALEAYVQRMEQQEQQLAERASAQTALDTSLQQNREQIARMQEQVAAWRARLHAEEIAGQGERARLLADVQHREELARRHSVAVAEALEDWNRRRALELEQLRADRQDCARLHQECIVLRVRWLERSTALEFSRQDRENLARELAALDKRYSDVERRLHELWTARAEFEGERTAWEQNQLEASARETRIQKELQLAEFRRLRTLEELAKMRDEVETVTQTLLGETPPEHAQEKAA